MLSSMLGLFVFEKKCQGKMMMHREGPFDKFSKKEMLLLLS